MSAEDRTTALAVLDWTEPTQVSVRALHLGVSDGAILDLVLGLEGPEVAAFDAPFGWPQPFVDFLVGHHAGTFSSPESIAGLAWRRQLSRRTTDLYVEQAAGVRPLSVAADRIAAVAMRQAAVLSVLARNGVTVDRTGCCGPLLECYPAAALASWGLPHRGYKGNGKLAGLPLAVEALRAAAPWLDLAPYASLLASSDDAFDAVIAALVARSAMSEATALPTSPLTTAAEVEGWIHLPTAPLSTLPLLDISRHPAV
ncbi:MAG: DUF429 domain-containing protein [Motilibacteraceae bacterium]